MRAYVVSGYTLEEIQSMINDGYQIADDGSLIPPIVEETELIEETELMEETKEVEEETDLDDDDDNKNKSYKN